jgi:hypothetical protein
MTTTYDRNLDRALVLADEYLSLSERGDVTLAGEAARTIDDLVGHWSDETTFVWPAEVAEHAGRASGAPEESDGYSSRCTRLHVTA